MKRNIAAVGLLLAAITSPALAQDTPQTSGADSRGIEVMLVQSADQASFDGKTLTLKGLAPTTVFFADRPERIVGHVSHADLVKSWMEGQDNFKADPPNAAFSILSDTGEPQVAIVELLNPKLEGDAISYDVTVLEGTLPESASQVALFIDPWIWRPRGWVRGPYVGPACHWSYYGARGTCVW